MKTRLKQKWLSLMVTLFVAFGAVFSVATAAITKAKAYDSDVQVTVNEQHLNAGEDVSFSVFAYSEKGFAAYQLKLEVPDFVKVNSIVSLMDGEDTNFTYAQKDAYTYNVNFTSEHNEYGNKTMFEVYASVDKGTEGRKGMCSVYEAKFTDMNVSRLSVETSGAMFYVNGGTQIAKGDFNGDGDITIQDVMLMQRAIAYETELSEEQFYAGDIDKDGVVDIYDCQYVRLYLIGEISDLENIGGNDQPHGGEESIYGEYSCNIEEGNFSMTQTLTLNEDRTFTSYVVINNGAEHQERNEEGTYIYKGGDTVYLVKDYGFAVTQITVANRTCKTNYSTDFSENGLVTAEGYAGEYNVNDSEDDIVTIEENGAFYRTCVEDGYQIQYNGMIVIDGTNEDGLVLGTAYVFGTNDDDCLMAMPFALDESTNTIYVENDREEVYTSFYYGMQFTFCSDYYVYFNYGGNEMSCPWIYAKGYVVMIMGEELMAFSINEDGRTLTPTEFSPNDFVFRVAVKNKNSETVATYPISFNEKGESVTPVTLNDDAYFVIERSFDGETYYNAASYDSMYSAGNYEVNYSIEFHQGGGYHSNFSVVNTKYYSAYGIGRLALENDGKFYRVDDKNGNEELVKIEFSVDNGVYAFDCSYGDEPKGTLYYTLGEGRKFNAYIPETSALYTYNENNSVIKLYNGEYAVYNDGYSKYTVHYELQTNESREMIVIFPRFIMGGDCVLMRSDGSFAYGWQRGDVQVEAQIRDIIMYGDNRFVVGEGSLDKLQLQVTYTDGSTKTINASQVELLGTINFNKSGRYDIQGTYEGHPCNVWCYVGYANEVFSRYISGDNIWLIENGKVVADYSSLVMQEQTFGGSYRSIQLTESDFNATDLAMIRRGKSQDVYTLRTIYTYPYDNEKYISVTIVLISIEDMRKTYTKIEVQDRVPLVYVVDEERFISALYSPYVQIDFEIEIKENDKTYTRTFYYKKQVTQEDLIITGDIPFMTNTGNYKVPIYLAFDPEHSYEVSVMSINIADVMFMAMLYNNNGPYTLPNACVGEAVDDYIARMMSAIVKDEVSFVAYWIVGMETPISGEEYYHLNENIFDFSDFDTSVEGKQNIHYVTTDLYGAPYVVDIAINVVSR